MRNDPFDRPGEHIKNLSKKRGALAGILLLAGLFFVLVLTAKFVYAQYYETDKCGLVFCESMLPIVSSLANFDIPFIDDYQPQTGELIET